MPREWSTTKSAGFSVVEVLLAAVVFGMLTTAVIGAVVYGRAATANAGDRQRANLLAQEGLEAARNIRDAAYSNLVDGTYGIAQSGGVWTLSGASDTSDVFTRQITIATAGANRKTVTSTVSWNQGFGTNTASISTELTNWLASMASWLGAIIKGGLDGSGTGNGYKVATVGNYAYIVRNSGTPNFLVVNVSNPAAPTLAASLTLATAPTNISVSGNYAYVTTSSDTAELQIVNITTPTAPVLTSSYNASGNGNGLDVAVSGNYAYLVRAANGGIGELTIINISNPAAPVLAGSYGNNIAMQSIVLSGNYAIIGTNSTTQGLLVVNVAVPALPLLNTSYALQSTTPVNALYLNGTTLLVGQSTALSLLDFTNPLSATRIGTVTTMGSALVNDITVDSTGKYAFLGTNNTTAELQIADIGTPASPAIVRTVDIAGTASALNGVAYNAALDEVVGASAADTQEAVIFVKN